MDISNHRSDPSEEAGQASLKVQRSQLEQRLLQALHRSFEHPSEGQKATLTSLAQLLVNNQAPSQAIIIEGLPGTGKSALLKAASLWLAGTFPTPEPQTWTEALLAEPSIQNRLQELWQGLTGEEQLALSDLQPFQEKELLFICKIVV